MSRELLLLEIMRRDVQYVKDAEFIEKIRERRERGEALEKIAQSIGLSAKKVTRICRTYHIPRTKRASASATAG